MNQKSASKTPKQVYINISELPWDTWEGFRLLDKVGRFLSLLYFTALKNVCVYEYLYIYMFTWIY